MPVETGNNALKDGILQKVFAGFTETCHPESSYFYADHGMRGMCAVFDMKDASSIPSIAEPFFLNLNATVDFFPVMNAEDLKYGLEKVKKMF